MQIVAVIAGIFLVVSVLVDLFNTLVRPTLLIISGGYRAESVWLCGLNGSASS